MAEPLAVGANVKVEPVALWGVPSRVHASVATGVVAVTVTLVPDATEEPLAARLRAGPPAGSTTIWIAGEAWDWPTASVATTRIHQVPGLGLLQEIEAPVPKLAHGPDAEVLVSCQVKVGAEPPVALAVSRVEAPEHKWPPEAETALTPVIGGNAMTEIDWVVLPQGPVAVAVTV